MKIFITGATGFVGKNTLSELTDEDYNIFTLIRKKTEEIKAHLIVGDLLNLKNAYKLDNLDVIIHIAGITKSLHSHKFYEINSRGTYNLINFAIKKKVKHFIYISSLAAVGPSSNRIPKKENSLPVPVSDYGMSKLIGEYFLKKSGLNYTIIRPPAIFGPEDKDILTYFKMVNKKFALISGDKKKLYSMIYVKDLAKLIKLVILNEKAFNNTFFIANKKFYTITDILSAIENSLNKKSVKISIPEFTVNFFIYPLQIFYSLTNVSPLLNLDKLKEIKEKNWICSGEKLFKHLNYFPSYSFEEAIKETAQWYIEKNWL